MINATERANFGTKITPIENITVHINGRCAIHQRPATPTGDYYGDLCAEYYIPNGRSSTITVRWDSKNDEPHMSHASGGGTVDETRLFANILSHAAGMMVDWKVDGWKSTFNTIFMQTPWEHEDDRIGKSQWTDVSCDEWDAYAKRIKDEQKGRTAEAFALEHDPYGFIMPLVLDTLDRIKTRKSLATRRTSNARWSLAALVNGELNRPQERALKDGGIDGLHASILSSIVRVLEPDHSKAGEGIYQEALEELQTIKKRIARRYELAQEIKASEHKTSIGS